MFSFFSEAWSFLSSAPERAGARLAFLLGAPLPLPIRQYFVRPRLNSKYRRSEIRCRFNENRHTLQNTRVSLGFTQYLCQNLGRNVPFWATAPSFLRRS